MFYVSIKTFCRKWQGETLPKWFFISKQLEKCQNKYYPDNPNLMSSCKRASLHILLFPISLLERNLWSHWKCQTFEGKMWPFFMTWKNRDLFSSKRLLNICTIRPTIQIAVNTLRLIVMYTLSYNCLKCLVNRSKIAATIWKNCKNIILVWCLCNFSRITLACIVSNQ